MDDSLLASVGDLIVESPTGTHPFSDNDALSQLSPPPYTLEDTRKNVGGKTVNPEYLTPTKAKTKPKKRTAADRKAAAKKGVETKRAKQQAIKKGAAAAEAKKIADDERLWAREKELREKDMMESMDKELKKKKKAKKTPAAAKKKGQAISNAFIGDSDDMGGTEPDLDSDGNDIISVQAAKRTKAKALETPKRKRSVDQVSTGATDEGHQKKKQKKVVTHPAKDPSKTTYAQFNTEHYAIYDTAHPNLSDRIAGTVFTKFADYDFLPLFCDVVSDIAVIPVHNQVRLDDYNVWQVSRVIGSTKLSKHWITEFDQAGMTRATRMPLGNAAKAWKKVGDEDIDGNVVQPGQEGWYYLWYKGLQLLCGKEGFDAGLYKIRPSHEPRLSEKCVFKIGYKAQVQLAPGDPADPTFQ